MSESTRPPGRTRHIISAYGTSLLGVFSGLLTNLWLIRRVTQEVLPADFGIYALVLQITAYLGTLQLGLDFAASRRIAEALGRGDASGANQAYWEVARFNRWAAALLAFLALILAGGLRSKIGVTADRASLASTIAVLSGGAMAVNFLARRWSAALIGSQQQATVNTIAVANAFGVTFLAYTLLRLGLGILCLPTSLLVLAGGSAVALSVAASRSCPWLTREPAEHDRAVFRSLVGFGSYSTLGSISWTVEVTSDVVILGALQGTSVVAAYVLWWRFPSMLFDFCTRLVGAAFPSFAERHGLSVEHASRLLGKVGQLSIGLATLALVGIGLWLPAFMRLWLGEAYALPDARKVALGLALVVALRTYGNLLGMFWLASGNARYGALLGWAQALVKVVVAVGLVRPLGIVGMAIASCLASCVQIAGLGGLLAARGYLPGRLVAHGGILSGSAVVAVLTVWRPGAGATVVTFAAGVAVTAVTWAVLWTAFAWNSELRPNLQKALGLVGLAR